MKNFSQFIFLLFVLFTFKTKAQSIDSALIAFYNVENLFDTLNDPLTDDDTFLPYGIHGWNTSRYVTKSKNISRVIASLNDWEGPDLIGLCEVENRNVLLDLISRGALKNKGYKIIHKDSPDGRGIDVCALYKPEVFALIDYDFIPISIPNSSRTTRDILYVMVQLKSSDTLHCFFNHWPSRYGGEVVSESKRLYVSSVVQNKVDSILRGDSDSKIIVMGDFNDGPKKESLLNLEKRGLKNVEGKNDYPGTHKYQSEWNTFDLCLISKAFGHYKVEVFSPSWLLMKDEKYTGQKPKRTFNGPQYLGGYSDHFPVSIKLYD